MGDIQCHSRPEILTANCKGETIKCSCIPEGVFRSKGISGSILNLIRYCKSKNSEDQMLQKKRCEVAIMGKWNNLSI